MTRDLQWSPGSHSSCISPSLGLSFSYWYSSQAESNHPQDRVQLRRPLLPVNMPPAEARKKVKPF